MDTHKELAPVRKGRTKKIKHNPRTCFTEPMGSIWGATETAIGHGTTIHRLCGGGRWRSMARRSFID